MKSKKLLALLLCAVIIIPTLVSCSKAELTSLPSDVAVIDDDDDNIDDNTSEEKGKSTFEFTDRYGNVITAIPFYNVDGATMIAVYVESAKDKKGNALDQEKYPYIQQVLAIQLDSLGEPKLTYQNSNPVSLNALADKNGYIIAVQDVIDIDNDKDTEEYFEVVTKVDSVGNLFIKLQKGEDGKPVNVTVDDEKDGGKKVTTDDGKSVSAQKSEKSKNLEKVAEKEVADRKKETTTKKKSDDSKNNSGNGSGSGNNNSSKDKNKDNNKDKNNNKTPSKEPSKKEDPKPEYISIVLKKGGSVASDGKNVSFNPGSIDTGSEVIIDGAGECSKYYVTSETDVFLGHLVFNLSIGESVEVKFNDVNINTKRKTAINFTNVDKDNEKENDNESKSESSGESKPVESAAPKVNLVFTGENKFTAHGVGTNGTIYSECRLDIKGHGTAEIDGGENLSGICSTESIDIRNATLNITSRAKQGISCDRKVTVEFGASININSKGDGIHCNKFEMCDPNEFPDKENATPASVKIQSLYTEECADGIDSNDYIIIRGGTLDVTALSQYKFGLKVRKVNDGKTKGQFEINGGKVTVSADSNSELTNCAQKTLLIQSSVKQQFSVGGYKSAENVTKFLCSPCSAETVTMINRSGKSTECKVDWQGNIGTAKLLR
ncbi:MAG: carbohydrate-binding domain-containing protein [Eubacterium sp.]|nr:carbohydrate-binding domain-containing protein [Eubacterium sp.]